MKPGDKSFQQLVTIIQENECPQRSVIVQRFIFNSGVQKQGESVADFVADLRHLAEHCGAREDRSRRHPRSDYTPLNIGYSWIWNYHYRSNV